MLKKLGDFYLFDDKLLYARKDFVGYNPTISKPLTHEKPDYFGTKIKVNEFKMRGSSFDVILTYFIAGGPLRGYKKIEVIKNGRTIIRYENGSKGHSFNYSDGNFFLVEHGNAYLVATGSAMKDFKSNKIYSDLDGESYYFFWFTDIVIPTTEEIVINYDLVPEKEIYNRNEIKHLRQVEWHAKTVINNHEIDISKSSIPGFWRTTWNSNGYEEFRKFKQMNELAEMRIIVDGVNSLEEENNGS